MRGLHTWHCTACAETFSARRPPAECYSGDRRCPACPGCGEDTHVVRIEERDGLEDDGRRYSDPRDYRRGLE